MSSLETMVKEAEELQAKIITALDPLGARDLLKIWQYITENFWTEPREEEEENAQV